MDGRRKCVLYLLDNPLVVLRFGPLKASGIHDIEFRPKGRRVELDSFRTWGATNSCKRWGSSGKGVVRCGEKRSAVTCTSL